jgi:aspartyl-tRNA(Asn)/glutamyl-tRNA(Gln) amidotransferase subunit C
LSYTGKTHVKTHEKLSRLQLDDAEIDSFQKEISSILNYVEQLSGVETEGLSPTYQVNGLSTVTRDDVVIPYKVSRDQLFENVPKMRDDQIEVKRMII